MKNFSHIAQPNAPGNFQIRCIIHKTKLAGSQLLVIASLWIRQLSTENTSLAGNTIPINQKLCRKVTSITMPEEEHATVHLKLSEERQLRSVSLEDFTCNQDNYCFCVTDELRIN